MYSQKVIDFNLEEFAAREKWMPERHSLEWVNEFKAYIESITSMESNSKTSYVSLAKNLTEKRKKEIRQHVINEQVLCGLDSSYFESRYAYICDEQGQIYKFKNRMSQDVFDSVIAEFDEKQVSIEILCLDPETKVLTADLRWVKIDDLKVGDELVATDEGDSIEVMRRKNAKSVMDRKKGIYKPKVPGRKNNPERKMRTAVVEAKWDTFGDAIEISFEDGRKIICSPRHQFLYKQHGGVLPIWGEAKFFRIGDKIRSVTSPWGDSTYEDGWYGGFLDGEGCMSKPSDPGTDACVAQRFNVALERARKYLRDRGYGFREEIDVRGTTPNGKIGKDPVAKLFVGRSDELFRLMGQTRPARFIKRRWWEGKCLPGKRSASASTWATVASIKLLPAQKLVDIQTSTRTFLAEGLVTHNCLKARQLGVTTKTVLKFLHRMLFVPHTQAVMASVQAEKSELISRIHDTVYNRSPWWLVPRRLPKRSFANGSILSIQSGMQATGIAQGWTPTMIHVSELADLPNPKKVIEEGLLRATHSSRNLFMVFEGTGGGNTGWLADTWKSCKADWPKGLSRLCPIFIPWAMATDLYPEADWIRKFPVPEAFYEHRGEATRKHVARAESYIRNTSYLAKVAGHNWRMPIEQQWFWEFNYNQACQNHTQKIWLAQMPADDFEALTGIHDTVFDPETINDVEDYVYDVRTEEKTRKRPMQAYAIQGDSIDDCFIIGNDDPRIDWDKPVIRVTWRSHRGKSYEWEMIPLLPINEEIEKYTFDLLLVYEEPQAGCDYSCGVDTADGLDKEDEERACASIDRVQFGSDFDVQVAELTSRRMNPAQMTGFVACIAAYYGVSTKDWRGVKFAIEQVRGPGDTCQNQLKLMGFNYHHAPRRYDSKKVKDASRSKEGWYSNSWSVPILMTRFVQAVNDGWYKPQSWWMIEELKTLERHITSGKSKMEHRAGQFDDRVRAAAQSYFTVHDLDDLAERAKKRNTQPVKKKTDPNAGRGNTNSFSVGGWE